MAERTVTKAALTGAAATAGVIVFHGLYTSQAVNGLFWSVAVAAPWTVALIGLVAPAAYVAGLAALIAFIWSRP